mmetsp:Transcript_9695/g.29467  ORF Transcript_9695/g.29467 Transcript_9695/m.29467 type:complete len:238 (-) Transcript_9695:2873-3586(-)
MARHCRLRHGSGPSVLLDVDRPEAGAKNAQPVYASSTVAGNGVVRRGGLRRTSSARVCGCIEDRGRYWRQGLHRLAVHRHVRRRIHHWLHLQLEADSCYLCNHTTAGCVRSAVCKNVCRRCIRGTNCLCESWCCRGGEFLYDQDCRCIQSGGNRDSAVHQGPWSIHDSRREEAVVHGCRAGYHHVCHLLLVCTCLLVREQARQGRRTFSGTRRYRLLLCHYRCDGNRTRRASIQRNH